MASCEEFVFFTHLFDALLFVGRLLGTVAHSPLGSGPAGVLFFL